MAPKVKTKTRYRLELIDAYTELLEYAQRERRAKTDAGDSFGFGDLNAKISKLQLRLLDLNRATA